jgi:hypothetical protein
MVKGLGNLHFRLANNSSWLDVAALVDNGPWEGRSAWIMSGLLLCLSLLYFLHELFFSGTSWAKIYALCILFAIPFLPGINVPSLYYDYPSIIIHCIVVLEILYIITNKKICHQHFIIIIGLTTLCFMMKSIDPVIIIVVPSFILFTLIKRKEFCFTVAAKIMVLPLIAAVLWIGKNLILSGYPLFPVPALPVWFDWTMTRGDVNACYQAVRGFARTMNAWKGVMPSGVTEWFPFWLQRQMGNNSFRTVMLLPFLMACPLWGWLLARGRTPKILFVFGWQIAGLIGWFAAAPDPRFGYGFVLSFLASGAALAVWERKADLKKIARMGGYILIVLLLIRLGRDLRKAPHSLWGIGAHPPGPAAMRIVEGQGYPFTLRIPLSENKWCDNAELPCAPWEPQNLCLRKPYDLGEGFRPCTR